MSSYANVIHESINPEGVVRQKHSEARKNGDASIISPNTNMIYLIMKTGLYHLNVDASRMNQIIIPDGKDHRLRLDGGRIVGEDNNGTEISSDIVIVYKDGTLQGNINGKTQSHDDAMRHLFGKGIGILDLCSEKLYGPFDIQNAAKKADVDTIH